MLVTLAPWPHAIEAQPASAYDEVGNFYLQSFGPEDYGWHPQNWGVVQGPNGLVYVGNGKGVLEYDGVSWRRILLANRTAGAALAVDADGRIFVGGDGLGYLAPDEHGRMQYVSLLDELPAEDRKLGTIRRAEATSDGVTFFTGDRLIRWNGREMKVWRAETAFRLIYVLDDVLYARQEGFGLMRIEGDALVMAPGGAFFRGKQIYGLLPGPDGSHLVFTRQQGIFQCSASERAAAGSRDPVCTPFNPGLTDLLIELQAYYAVALPGGLRAIGTLRGGVILLDQEGRLLRILNEASGLPSNTVYSAYVDREGGLWLSLNGGLARVEIGAPLSYWDKTSGLRGNVTDIARHEGRLYATTERGVYGLMPAEEGAAPRFLSSKALSAHCWTLLSTPQGLLAGCWSGLFNLDNQQQLWSIGSNSVFALHRSRRDPERLYLGLTDGLARMRLRDGQWTDVERIDGIDSRIYSIVEDDLGRLWVGTAADGVIRLEPVVSISDASASGEPALDEPASEDSALEDSASDEPASDASGAGDLIFTSFGAADGLPVGTTRVRQVAGRMVVLSEPERSLWRLDAEATGFVRDTSFDDVMPEGPDGIDELIEDDQGRVWIAAGAASGVAHPAPEGGYTWAPTALRRAPPTAAYSLHLDADGSLWRGGANELVRYDTRRALDRSASYPVWIRRVSAASGTTLSTASGTTLYDGRSGDLQAERPYRDNTLRFTFAAPRHDASARTEYRVRLEGRGLAARGEDWSAWTNETYKDYTELWEGRYVFSVQARDVYGYLSREDSFAFRILPPWYRSGWAYGSYLLLLAGALWGTYRAAYRAQQRKLEAQRRVNRQLREVDK
ncbi:MAG: two-component regulator propeller domain-containing protein, partial [Acidobacteriota bacterium]